MPDVWFSFYDAGNATAETLPPTRLCTVSELNQGSYTQSFISIPSRVQLLQMRTSISTAQVHGYLFKVGTNTRGSIIFSQAINPANNSALDIPSMGIVFGANAQISLLAAQITEASTAAAEAVYVTCLFRPV